MGTLETILAVFVVAVALLCFTALLFAIAGAVDKILGKWWRGE